MSKIKTFIVNIAVPLLVGGVSAFISRSGMRDFQNIAQPPLSPPAIVFPIVWTVLFILMGIAAYLVAVSDADETAADNALTVYGLQLGANFFWSIFFFNFGWYWFAFFWLLLLWVLILYTMNLFSAVSKPAVYLLVPYILWVSFAGYLNLGVTLLN